MPGDFDKKGGEDLSSDIDIQALVRELGITITDDTKPTELFAAVVKLLEGYADMQPDMEEITDKVSR